VERIFIASVDRTLYTGVAPQNGESFQACLRHRLTNPNIRISRDDVDVFLRSN